MTNLTYLVYIKGPGGIPQIQTWQELDFGHHNHQKNRVISTMELPKKHQGLPLSDLEKLYPCKRTDENG